MSGVDGTTAPAGMTLAAGPSQPLQSYPVRDPPPSFTRPTAEYSYRNFKKDLSLWRQTTDLVEGRIGGVLYRNLRGEARLAVDSEVSEEVLVTDFAYDAITAALDKGFGWQEETEMPAAIEQFFYQGTRTDRQTFAEFVITKRMQVKQLERHSIFNNDKIKGYVLTRQARLTEGQFDKVSIWSALN